MNNCEAQRKHLEEFSSLYQVASGSVFAIDTGAELMVWRRGWDSAVELEELEKLQLAGQRTTYYPHTTAKLQEVSEMLKQQRSATEEAARLREQYIESADSLSAIAERIDRARATAEYYRRLGAQAIYLLIMEDLAILEARYKDHRHSRQQTMSDSQQQLQLADSLNREIVRELNRLDNVISQDSKTSYSQMLIQRFQSFDLRQELDLLISGNAAAASTS
jgi:hypothetical protein